MLMGWPGRASQRRWCLSEAMKEKRSVDMGAEPPRLREEQGQRPRGRSMSDQQRTKRPVAEQRERGERGGN